MQSPSPWACSRDGARREHTSGPALTSLERDLGNSLAPITGWVFPGVDGCKEVGSLQPHASAGKADLQSPRAVGVVRHTARREFILQQSRHLEAIASDVPMIC